MEDFELLQSFRAGSDDAFATLVNRYLNSVYSIALRTLRSRELAEEVAFAVFAELAKKGPNLNPAKPLIPWLFRVTRFTALDVAKRERRRVAREKNVATERPEVHGESDSEDLLHQICEALDVLDEDDKHLILRRYFQGDEIRSIARSIGVSAEAAQKRVERAVARLRETIRRQASSVGDASFSQALHALVIPAPFGLTPTIASLTKAATAGVTLGNLAFMSVSHKLVTIAAMTALAGAIIYQKIQLRTLENELANAAAEIATLRNQVTEFEIRKAKFENVKPDASSDVLKLRAEVTQVRASRLETESTDESAARALGKRADQVKKWLRETPGEYIPELQLLTDKEILVEIAQAPETADNEWIAGVLRKHAKERFAGELGRALNDYVRQHEGQLPNDARELAPIISTSVPLEVFDRYSTVPGRATNEVPANEALIVEREPIQHSQYDARFRIGLYDYWYEKVDEFGESGRRNHTEKRQTEVTN